MTTAITMSGLQPARGQTATWPPATRGWWRGTTGPALGLLSVPGKPLTVRLTFGRELRRTDADRPESRVQSRRLCCSDGVVRDRIELSTFR